MRRDGCVKKEKKSRRTTAKFGIGERKTPTYIQKMFSTLAPCLVIIFWKKKNK
jgi:hypothetical protein